MWCECGGVQILAVADKRAIEAELTLREVVTEIAVLRNGNRVLQVCVCLRVCSALAPSALYACALNRFVVCYVVCCVFINRMRTIVCWKRCERWTKSAAADWKS